MHRTSELVVAVNGWRDLYDQAEAINATLAPEVRAAIDAKPSGLAGLVPVFAMLPISDRRQVIAVLDALGDWLATEAGEEISQPAPQRCHGHRSAAQQG